MTSLSIQSRPSSRGLRNISDNVKQLPKASSFSTKISPDKARVAAPDELVRIETILRERGTAINASDVPGLPRLEFVKSPTTRVANSRLDAGKFAIELQPYEQLRQFTVTVIVGLHPNAAQFLVSIPRIPSKTSTYRAAADDDGFFWTDTKRGGRFLAEEIVDHALDGLCELLEREL